MGMSLSLVCSQALQLRQNLECSLEQSLAIKQVLKLELKLYKKREDICTRLYKDALKKGNVRQYDGHGMKFEFALASKKDVPAWIYEQCGHAFSHCLMREWDCLLGGEKFAMARGSWLLFVIRDMYKEMPAKTLEYAAVHERGEMVTLGDHNLASKLEFAIAAEEKNLRWYMDWIEKKCPEKFSDVFSYQTHLELPASDEFQQILEVFQESEEARQVRRLIEEFDWPYTILQRLSKYKKANEEIASILNIAFDKARIFASHAASPLPETVEKIRQEIRDGLRAISESGLKRFISLTRINELWNIGRAELNDEFIKTRVRREEMLNENDYIKEVINANLSGGLPLDNELSPEFKKVIKLIR